MLGLGEARANRIVDAGREFIGESLTKSRFVSRDCSGVAVVFDGGIEPDDFANPFTQGPCAA